MTDQSTAAAATDDEIVAAGQETLLKMRAAQDHDSAASSPELHERVVDCGRCVSRRGADRPNQIRQTRITGLDVWSPPFCGECFAWNEDQQRRDADLRRAADDAARIERERQHFRDAGLPEPYVVGKRSVADLDAGPATESYLKARNACTQLLLGERDAPWLYLTGDNGSFKSTLACCTLLQALQAGLPGRYVLWPDALDDLRALNRDDAPEPVSRYVDRLVKVPRLVIDEIGFGTPTAFAAEKLFLVFERRYQLDSAADPGQRWLIFTSNRTFEQLVKSFAQCDEYLMAPRLERRLGEMSSEIVIKHSEAA